MGKMRNEQCVQTACWSEIQTGENICQVVDGIILKKDLKPTGCEDVDWIHLAEDYGPVADVCKHYNEPSSSSMESG
jgi:hypothetical protein